MLVALHTIMMREHNRIALELSKINSHWDDEKLFQETRHIVAAIVQQITYNEFLPMVLGKEVMERYELLGERQVSWNENREKNVFLFRLLERYLIEFEIFFNNLHKRL